MEKSFSESYKEAGVDVTAGYKAVELMKKSVQETYTKGVMSDLGGFGGLFKLDTSEMKEPILVSGTDGVGTKLKLAFLLDKHDTIGQDCVAMCVNDIVCCGAKPLFFLDYISLWKNIPEMVASIVKGVADGCKKAGCALVGGETAEMPGLYSDNEYDLAGFSVGVVDKAKMINPGNIEEGDVVILNAKRTKYYDISLREIYINTHHPWRDKELKDLNLPKNNLIVMIKREGGTVIPRGNTMIKDKDIVLLRDL